MSGTHPKGRHEWREHTARPVTELGIIVHHDLPGAHVCDGTGACWCHPELMSVWTENRVRL